MKKLWEVGVPSNETWVFEIEAETADEALQIANTGQYPNGDSVDQICSIGGAHTFVRPMKRDGKNEEV